MKSFYRPSFACLLTIAVSVATLVVNRPASAVLIKTGATTVFADNFEGQTTGGSPTTPNAQTGAWASVGDGYAVEDNTATPVPGAAEGTKYLSGVRPNGGVLIADFGPASVSSGTVSASFSIYIPVGGANDYVLQMALRTDGDNSGAGYFTAPVWLINKGNNIYSDTGGTETNTDVSIIQGIWQTWQVNYTFNAGANDDVFTITVAGNTSAPINAGGGSNVADPANLRYLSINMGAGGTFYLDAPVAVPEPASLGMFAIGGLLLARRRTQR